jgi:PadR family transcriptional regulator PadR
MVPGPPTLSVLKGTLDYLVLKTLSAGDAMHGFEILEWIGEATDEALLLEEGALYPKLHDLERRGWIEGVWGVSPKGRRAKYYKLTKRGAAALARQEAKWKQYVAAVTKIAARAEGT